MKTPPRSPWETVAIHHSTVTVPQIIMFMCVCVCVCVYTRVCVCCEGAGVTWWEYWYHAWIKGTVCACLQLSPCKAPPPYFCSASNTKYKGTLVEDPQIRFPRTCSCFGFVRRYGSISQRWLALQLLCMSVCVCVCVWATRNEEWGKRNERQIPGSFL